MFSPLSFLSRGKFAVICFVVILVGCEATAVKNSARLKTKTLLNPSVTLPVQVPVAIYVNKVKPEKGVNFHGKLEEAAILVAGDMFSTAETLSATSKFQYLLKVKAISDWDRVWGGWQSHLTLDIVEPDGTSVFSANLSKKSSGGGLYDFNAVHNALAGAIKELLVQFFNQQGAEALVATAESFNAESQTSVSLKSLIKDMKPSSTGTGFFINKGGDLATAAHVVDECLYVEVMHKGETLPAKIQKSSNLLDLAVLSSGHPKTTHVHISRSETQAKLGKQVFVTGFPLAGILSDYPSLTVGNVSSLGGLKGAEGHFQFSAPVQPGNSGGAIVDYKGNLVGVVSSSLNQSMLLKETGTTSQNVNFGVDLSLVKKFFEKSQVNFQPSEGRGNFESASAEAVEYTNQVLCYN